MLHNHYLCIFTDGQCLFRAFLQREFSEENVEFWLAVEEFRNTNPSKLQMKAHKIYNDFIVMQSPKEVKFSYIKFIFLNQFLYLYYSIEP